MRKFLINIAVYLSALSMIILALNICYVLLDPEYNSMNVPENIQICNFGSSHGLRSFNYDRFTDRYVCSNFGMNAQSLLYDYQILRKYQANIQSGATVFIVASYFSFFGIPESEEKAFLSKNKRYYKFLPPESILQYNWMTALYMRYLPCLTTGGLKILIKNIINLKSGNKPAKLNEDIFNISDDFWNKTTVSLDMDKDVSGLYRNHIQVQFDKSGKRIRKQAAFDSIYSMIDLCRKINARPILVTVPYLREYTDFIRKNDPEFFPDFYAAIEEIRRNTGIEYYDYAFDERFCRDHSLFINSDHMNRLGARKFTNTLLHEVLGIEPD